MVLFVFLCLFLCFLSGRCYGHVYTVVGGCFLRRDINQMVPQWPLRLCGYLVQSRASVGNQNLDWRTMVHISLWCFVFYSFHQHGFTYFVVVSFEHFLFHWICFIVVIVVVFFLSCPSSFSSSSFQQDDSHWTLPKCLLEPPRNVVVGGRGGLF